MGVSEGASDQRAKVLAAARAAAEWARARRASWTDTPLPILDSGPDPQALGVVADATPVAEEPSPSSIVATHEAARPATTRPSLSAGDLTASLVRWVVRAAAAAALGALGITGAMYLKATLASGERAPAVKSQPSGPAAPARRPTGNLTVKSRPPGAEVLVDGEGRGVTPLSLTGLVAGPHALEFHSAEGTFRRSVTVVADQTTEVEELIFAGWIAVYAPFDVSITEGATALRLDDRNEIMLPAGPHDLRLVNRTLEYDVVRHVELKPGAIVRLEVEAPRSTMTVTASEPAEVWLDGVRVGDTPLATLPVDLGAHELVLKRATGVERRFPVTVTAKPFGLHVDLSNPNR